MLDAEKGRFMRLLATLAECTATQVSTERAQIYWEMLKDQPYESIEELAKRQMMTSKFFPAICELRVQPPSAVDKQTVAERAAEEVWAVAFSAFGENQRFKDPVIHRAIVRHWGGWPMFLDAWNKTSTRDMAFLRRDFCAAYLRAVEDDSPAPLVLQGSYERSNVALGYQAEATPGALPPGAEVDEDCRRIMADLTGRAFGDPKDR